jgi:asparagine synthase (glutamine-hydrolysing)
MLPTYIISKFAHERVKVVLTGDGGDELFGGYNNYLHNRILEPLRRCIGLGSKKWMLSFIDHIARVSIFENSRSGYRLRRLSELLSLPPEQRYASLSSYLSKNVRHEIAADKDVAQWDVYQDLYEPILREIDEEDVWARILNVDFRTYLPGDILTKVDRASMATSLEARVPLLDHEIVEFAHQLPMRFKIRRLQTKYILKRLAARRIPRSVVYRKKQGFSIPLDGWLRNELRDYAHDILLGNTRSGLFDRSAIEAMLLTHDKKTRNLGEAIWSLIMFELWYGTWFLNSTMRGSQ